MSDPFDVFADGDQPRRPAADFEHALRARVVAALGLDETLEPRRNDMTTTTTTVPDRTTASDRPTRREGVPAASRITPYLAVDDAAAAIDFYVGVLGAVELFRLVGDDGRIGHAELAIGDAHIYLADEHPEIAFSAPGTLGGSCVTLHLDVPDVDERFAAAVRAGSRALYPPADQPHGSRHGTLLDPFGHRWMLSQRIEQVDVAEYGERMADGGYAVERGPGADAADAEVARVRAASSPDVGRGGIWAAVNSNDAPAAIRFLVDVLGFEEQLVVPGDEPGVVVHSQLRWPEGGIVQVSTADRTGNIFSQRPVGVENLYVITADPAAVHDRCVAAGVEIVAPLASPDHDPDGSGFSLRDPEGNLWSFGTYAGEG